MEKKHLKKISDYLYEIPINYKAEMKVPARIFTDEEMLEDILGDKSLEQTVNVATLPGILRYSFAMPDVHQGYGFPVGGVAASVIPDGIISPGGIGYDINCGVRLLASQVIRDQIEHHREDLIDHFYRTIPSGVGKGGRLRLRHGEIDEVLRKGAQWVIEKGYGTREDLEHIEERGCLTMADPSRVSEKAKNRGSDQLGTLGSGNHFLEVQRVEEVYVPEVAKVFGLFENQITIMLHTGSRGLGHQICTDYLKTLQANREIVQSLPDRELIYAYQNSREGQAYLQAMACAANFAWANRQYLSHLVREVWEEVLRGNGLPLKLKLIYDVAHNLAKKERCLTEEGKWAQCWIHRKGATRAFGPGSDEIPTDYREVGQPVLIPGSMGTASYVLVGTKKAMEETFGSVCHGAGRHMSRHAAKRMVTGQQLRRELEEKGIIVRCRSDSGLAEEAPMAYKDIDRVVEITCKAGLASKVARLIPLGVVKGE